MEDGKRIVYMGTPEFSVPALEGLVQSEYEVVAVYTRPDKPVARSKEPAPSPVKRVALEHGIEVVQPVRLREPAEVERLAALRPDAIVVAAYGQILPQSVLDIPASGCLNIHPSLLPKYRGASPIASAILEGEEDTGITIMLMDAGMDTGPIISQFVVGIEPDDTTGSLGERLARAGARLLAETLPMWFEGWLTPRPQDESEATYTKQIAKEDGAIDWHMSAFEIQRRVRAFQPWPGCYTWWQGRMLKIVEAVPVREPGAAEPGRVVAMGPDQQAVVGVGTGGGVLGLLNVQLEGKRAMPAAEFIRGQRDFVGGVLEGKPGP